MTKIDVFTEFLFLLKVYSYDWQIWILFTSLHV